MQIKTGCDIANIEKFKLSADRGGEEFLKKIFSDHELSANHSIESLVGIFSAKESIIKALDMRAGEWRKIEIVKTETGRPKLKIDFSDEDIASCDISISHDGDYAVSTAAFLIK